MKFNLNLDNINYIKIVYRDAQDTTCCSKAAIKHMGEREILACAKFEDMSVIKTPQEVTLSFVCDNGLYRTNTTLKYVNNNDPYTYFALQTPEGLEYQQNREYFRVHMEEDALLSFEGKVIPAKTHDISANGVRLILPEKMKIPEDVIIDLLFQPKSIKAKVVITTKLNSINFSYFTCIHHFLIHIFKIKYINIYPRIILIRNTSHITFNWNVVIIIIFNFS